MWNIRVVVDTNDADYSECVTEISNEDLEKIKPLIEAIKNFEPYTVPVETMSGKMVNRKHRHNYPYGVDLPRKDLGEKLPEEIYGFDEEVHEIFEECCPSSVIGFHTVEKVEVWPVNNKQRLL